MEGIIGESNLVERTRVLNDIPDLACLSQILAVKNECFVLYVMSRAIRSHENPALNVAITVANQLKLPIVVATIVRDRMTHSTNRKHTFLLEGIREVEKDFKNMGINFFCHIQSPGNRAAYHLQLAFKSSIIVVEEPYVQPHLQIVQQVINAANKPVLIVDTDCIVPPQMIEKRSFHSATSFEKFTQDLRLERIISVFPTPSISPDCQKKGYWLISNVLNEIFMHSVSLSNQNIQDLLLHCEIDQSVQPISHISMGGADAGYNRWEAFKQNGLKTYHKCRNNPLLMKRFGVSRMSCYLNLGMVSPFRIAREVSEITGKGPAKFLNEMQTWREFAYFFCFQNPNHATIDALPRWAQKTLQQHSADPRHILSLDVLKQARSGNQVWDLMQQSLLLTGELHNNMRMTWGKAVIGWTENASQAYQHMIYLNDHFALDGESPPGYLGMLWCLGGFDRPHTETSVFGKVRNKSLESYARKLNCVEFSVLIGANSAIHSPKLQFQQGNRRKSDKRVPEVLKTNRGKNSHVNMVVDSGQTIQQQKYKNTKSKKNGPKKVATTIESFFSLSPTTTRTKHKRKMQSSYEGGGTLAGTTPGPFS